MDLFPLCEQHHDSSLSLFYPELVSQTRPLVQFEDASSNLLTVHQGACLTWRTSNLSTPSVAMDEKRSFGHQFSSVQYLVAPSFVALICKLGLASQASRHCTECLD